VRFLYAVNCEHAHARTDGRLDLHGIFQQLYAPGFPAKQDQMVVAVGVEWDVEGEGRQEFKIDLVDPNGSPCLTIRGHTDVTARVPGEAPPRTLLVLPMEEVVFPSAGTYLYRVEIGGEALEVAPLHLIENPDA
jgi:hypothetical protein